MECSGNDCKGMDTERNLRHYGSMDIYYCIFLLKSTCQYNPCQKLLPNEKYSKSPLARLELLSMYVQLSTVGDLRLYV